MSLKSDIGTIINNLAPNATYTVSSWFKANYESYKLSEISVDKPLIILDNDLKITKQIQLNANYLANTQIKLYFLVKVGVYASDNEQDDLLEQIMPLVDQVANNIYQLSGIRFKGSDLGEWGVVPRRKVFNSVLSGLELTANWKYNEVANWCKTSVKQDNFISTDTPGLNIEDDYIPKTTDTIHES